jgi:phosphatidylinositol alpha-mannosyltransferase
MNIAVISYYLPPTDRIGSGVQTHYLANAYVRAGHDVTMLSPYATADVDALYSSVKIPSGNRNRTFQFALNLRRFDFSNYDLVHAGMDDWALLGVKRPYHLRTFHGSCFAEALVADNLKSKIRMSWLGLTEWLSCAVADKTIAVSHNTLRFIPFCNDVIWNGIDKAIFSPGVTKSVDPSILFVGTLDSRKRGRLLLDVFQSQVQKQFPKAELWLVRETNDPGLPGVKVFGSVTNERLAELYRNAWIFCLPSSYEGFGVPYIEAMASGTAVVSTPNLGALEVTGNGEYGRIVSEADLGSGICDLLSNHDSRNELAALGLERTNSLDWDALIKLYLAMVPEHKL